MKYDTAYALNFETQVMVGLIALEHRVLKFSKVALLKLTVSPPNISNWYNSIGQA